jgi:hypothetical protein
MRSIHESDPSYFEKEETATDINGEELCPVCGCCSLVEADVAPGSIFTQAEQILSGKSPDKRLVCAGGCMRDKKHN